MKTEFIARHGDVKGSARIGDAAEGLRTTDRSIRRGVSLSIWESKLLKREDLAHTGAHKINNTVGQDCSPFAWASHADFETGAGQHGVATATACALLGLECEVFMGEVDIRRQALNVERMRMLGAAVTPVSSGAGTPRMRCGERRTSHWAATVDSTHYIIGSVVGPHPFPWIVREFQRVIGEETIARFRGPGSRLRGRLCRGGSNSMGMFHPFVGRGCGWWASRPGVWALPPALTVPPSVWLAGCTPRGTHVPLQDGEGQVLEAHSISAGLDYPGVGPEHAYFKDAGVAEYESATDEEAVDAMTCCAAPRGIIRPWSRHMPSPDFRNAAHSPVRPSCCVSAAV